jgi:hypothetical protein
MDASTESKKTSAPVNKTVVAVAALVLLAIVAIAAFFLLGQKEEDDGGLTIGYSSEAKVMLDQDALSAAMQAAMENDKNNAIGLRYKNNAYSTDGLNFECSITNSGANAYDMFLTIFADVELTDQIFLSGLVPPGSGFDHITLDHELELGDHRVYVVLTQVETDQETSKQTIIRQVAHTMDFHVTEE